MKRVRGEVLSTRKLGAYHQLTVVAPEIAEKARPGQFVAAQMPEGREFLLRRQLAIHEASRRGGWAGTLEFVVDPAGPGTTWLAAARAHSFLDLIGPLGKGFAHPRRLTNCLLVAERHGAATLYFLAQELLAAGKRVDMVVGAETLDRVLKPIEAKRLSQTVSIMTADGTLGDRGTVIDALPEAAERSKAQVVYAAGPAATLERVAAFCRERGCPRRSRSRNGWGAASASATRASSRWRARTGAATTTSARASTVRSSTPPACCGTDGSANDPRCCRRRPRAAGGPLVAGVGGVKRTLAVDLGAGLVLPTPVLVASGCAGTGRELTGLVDLKKVGGLVSRSITLEARKGTPPPRIAETPSGTVWTTGLRTPGSRPSSTRSCRGWRDPGPPVIVSVAGGSLEEYVRLIGALQTRPEVAAIELHLSGPDEELHRDVLGRARRPDGRGRGGGRADVARAGVREAPDRGVGASGAGAGRGPGGGARAHDRRTARGARRADVDAPSRARGRDGAGCRAPRSARSRCARSSRSLASSPRLRSWPSGACEPRRTRSRCCWPARRPSRSGPPRSSIPPRRWRSRAGSRPT